MQAGGASLNEDMRMLIKQFQDEAASSGAIVYVVNKEAEICDQILRLAHERKCNAIVVAGAGLVSASGLKNVLVNAGIEVVETASKLGLNDHVNADMLRAHLRQKYIDADLGITEADAGIAETGTLIICGNEGNERLTMILPRIHVTLIKSNDLVSTMEDAVVKIKAFSDRFPRYITYLTGRNTTGDIPGALSARAQGPEEEVVIVLSTANESC